MKDNPYASAIGSLVEVCSRSDIAYFVSMFGIFQFNPAIVH